MSKYIKAELYRITRNKLFVSLYFIITAFTIVTLFLTGGEWLVSREILTGGLSFMMQMVFLLNATMIALHFRERTALYEIMEGTSPHIMIWYRIIIYIPLMLITFFLPIAVILLSVDASYGAIMQLAMTACIMIRLIFFNTCIVLTFKNIESMAFITFRVIIESLVIAFGEMLGFWKAQDASTYVPYGQLTMLGGEIATSLILKIVIGTVIEMVLMYILAYTSYKKKWAIKSVIQ